MKNSIFDPVRKKRVACTPEEEVRQQLIAYLRDGLGYPESHMSCEYPLKRGKKSYRGDLVIFGNRMEPYLLAECKAPGVKLNIDVFEQIIRYNHMLKVKYLMVTNGETSYCAVYDSLENKYKFIGEIPEFDGFS
ncbi:MAG: type I restriction enzyme HsdR N-terminal domain-containing protein [Bacteroidales bacterium]|nr:type I restriction enzyme HsdR N-terminal domain-containing protein [Bacteroidales bacterium]MDD2424833.1 type I restriction enzyme HsdR N-terminal domain-containing protein [Bacteroidales bacterium]MDD3989983.1 type I restriction enzyme HsdR N-terminal domain-containing protein [Bacteroidales bacterium]MDD4639055.1 type I restriction enzyme HsdR N-terminal domain-containing protein [Bacteroidales bacterium]